MPYGTTRNTGHGHRPVKYRYEPDICFGGANYRPRRKGRVRRNSGRSASGFTRGTVGPNSTLSTAERLLSGVADTIGLNYCSGQGCGFFASLTELEVKLVLFIVAGGAVLVGYAAYALIAAATSAINRAKSGAKYSDATVRKSLRTSKKSRHRPPTPEMLISCWNRSRNNLEGKILLGSLMCDLAVSVDASYVRGGDGEIIGRHGGIRGWLSQNAPSLLAHYKTLMHYKTVADKFRLACGLQEPDGAEEALGEKIAGHEETSIPRPIRHPKASELLDKHLTMTALEAALDSTLGLIRYRRRAS